MLAINYSDWHDCCKGIFGLPNNRSYLQYYPFTKLTDWEREWVMSEQFFIKYIKSGLFTYWEESWLITNHYIMKSSGEFRRAYLISPLMHLVYLTIGKYIADCFKGIRNSLITVYYAGNFGENRFYYNKDYDIFYKDLNAQKNDYQYFIKTDIKGFYDNINIDLLFSFIKDKTGGKNRELTQRELFLYKELLLMLGRGRFPLVENHTTSSFLATMVYLDEFDEGLWHYLQNYAPEIDGYQIIRYVDDLYILFNSQLNRKGLLPFLNRLIGYMDSSLYGLGLALNPHKTCFETIVNLNKVVSRSLYDDRVIGKPYKIQELISSEVIIKFLMSLNDIKRELEPGGYQRLVERYFHIEGLSYSAQEIYNTLVYGEYGLLSNDDVVKCLRELLSEGNELLMFDPGRLVALVLKTKDEGLIKSILNNLFRKFRIGSWIAHDTAIMIRYFIGRNFKHKDLLAIMQQVEPSLNQYCSKFCSRSFAKSLKNEDANPILDFYENRYYKKDRSMFYIFFLYNTERLKGNMFTAFAYYKSFFDRISAHLGRWKKGKPNINKYYQCNVLKELYSNVPDAYTLIEYAHELRRENPLVHASALLIDGGKGVYANLEKSIKDLSSLINEKMTSGLYE